MRFRNTGEDTTREMIRIDAGTDVYVEDPIVRSGGRVLLVTGGAVHCRINKQNLHDTLDTGNVVRSTGGTLTVEVTDHGDFTTFADADATPSVELGRKFKTANTGATTITDFDDGFAGQEITVIINDGNTTIDFTASGLKGNAGADWSPASGDHMNCVYDGTDWFCVVSDNTA